MEHTDDLCAPCPVRRRGMSLRRLWALWIGMALAGGGYSSAEDWPGLRGPTHDAISRETGLDDRWESGEPPILWVRELGQGYSSFAVVGDKAYTQYQTPFGQFLVCLEARTGRTLWEYNHGPPYEPLGIYPGPRSTPAAAENRVYGVSPDGLLICLRADTGRFLWQRNLNEEFGGRGTDFGYSASPVIVDGMVLLPVGGRGASVVALDAANGTTLWTAGDGSASYASILPITRAGRRFAVAYLENGVSIHDLATGRIAWQTELSHGYDEHSAAPLYEEPRLVLSAPFKAGATATTLEIDAGTLDGLPAMSARHAWHQPQFSNDVISSLLVDGLIYGFDLRDPQSKAHRPSRGEYRCLDAESGRILWSTANVGQASAIHADGKLLLVSDNGELILAEAGPEQYVERGRVRLFRDEICWTAPALADGRLFLRTHTRAICAYVGSKERLSTGDADGAIRSDEVPLRRVFRWSWLLNGEREHPFMRPDATELAGWFIECLGTWITAGAIAALTFAACPRRCREHLSFVPVLCGVWAVVAAAATPLLNLLGDGFHFTWPATLFAMFQWTMWSGATASLPGVSRSVRTKARIVDMAFLALCVLYFLILHRSSLPHEWVFLMGFLPAWPLARVVARAAPEKSPRLHSLLGIAAGFLVFFWSCGGLMLARTAWGF